MTNEALRPPQVAFLVVGSARSGTTLVQRLACEIPGVRMPPETHFFSGFLREMLARRSFPLAGADLREEIACFLARDNAAGLTLDTDAVVAELGGSCAHPFALFDVVVRHLAGPAEVWGEKTPGHLLWWRPVSRAAPWLQFVVVVRDPRAVVASNLTVPWRDGSEFGDWGEHRHLALAQRWAIDQHQASSMMAELGPRCLALRYEDVVADPDDARAKIAAFLGRHDVARAQAVDPFIVHGWEEWKHRALEAVTDDRVSAWKRELTSRQARQITALCAEGMRRFGYRHGVPSTAGAVTTALLGHRIRQKLARYRGTYRWYLWEIDRTAL